MKIVINCAMSADGKIALKSRKQTDISNEEDRSRVHKLRNDSDAILVGVDTVISDNPKLTVSEKYVRDPRHPIRLVVDSDGRSPSDSLVFNGASRTIVVTNESCDRTFPNAETIRLGDDEVDLHKLVEALEKIGVESLLVEGGSRVIWSFLKSKLADQVNIFIGSIVIGGDSAPTPAGGEGASRYDDIVQLELIDAEVLGNGLLVRYKVVK